MNITFAPRGILQIDDARLVYRNFEGRGSQFNREGDRNFAVVIDTEEAKDALINEGWNVKIKDARDDGDVPFMYLPVKVKFNERGPLVYLQSGRNRTTLNEDTVKLLDSIDILGVDLDIRPYNWEVGGKSGRTAYLQSICVTQDVDRFAQRFAEEEHPEE